MAPSATVACVCLEEQLKTDKEDTGEANGVWGRGRCTQQAAGERDQQADEIHGEDLSGHVLDIYYY